VAAAGSAVPEADAEPVAAGAAAVPAEAAAPGAAAAGGGAISDCPQVGQTTQAGSSTTLRQFWQRFGANGSAWPQYGHAATARSMNLSQYGHGCLKVGIVRSS
jgi:hypothetical protein